MTGLNAPFVARNLQALLGIGEGGDWATPETPEGAAPAESRWEAARRHLWERLSDAQRIELTELLDAAVEAGMRLVLEREVERLVRGGFDDEARDAVAA